MKFIFIIFYYDRKSNCIYEWEKLLFFYQIFYKSRLVVILIRKLNFF